MVISFYLRRFRAHAFAAVSVANLIISLSLLGCGGGTSHTSSLSPKTLTTISVSPTSPSVALGMTAQFNATGIYSDGSKQDLTATVSWNTTQPAIAVIDSTGMAMSKGVGTTAVTATSGSVSSSQNLTVSPATLASISVSPTNPSVALGLTTQFDAMGVYSDGTKQDLTNIVSWKTALPAVATINGTGMATSKGIGATAVIATSGSVSSSQTLTVSSSTLVSVAVGPQNPSLRPGSSVQLTATGTYTDGSHQDLTASAKWSSSLPTVATVSASGAATAVAGGAATITAVSGSLSGTDVLSVASLVSIAVTPSAPTIPLGETQSMIATGSFSDGSTQDLTNLVTWSSNASKIARISTTGLVSALAQGTATVTAQAGSISGTDLVTVGPPALLSLTVLPATATVALGGTQRFTASGTFSDGSTQDITGSSTWSSAAPTIAAVDNTGSAVALQIGNTTISATSGSASGSAALTVDPVLAITYFAHANVPGLEADATVRLSNTGATAGYLCAMIYVFDENQEMNECCGCVVTPDGLRTLSVNTDLTSNTLTGVTLHHGVIEVVPADFASNPKCNPASITPEGLVSTWATHLQKLPGNAVAETEDSFQRTPLSGPELSALQNDCSFVGSLGSGHGVCTCGSGD